MNIKGNLRKITELGIGLSAVTILALAGCGGGGGSTTSSTATIAGLVSTFAGTSGSWGLIDDTGAAARFLTPTYFATDGTNLYVTDWNANNIRKIVIATGAVSTFAGSPSGASGVGDAPALFNHPEGLAIDANNLYVADSGNNNIRQISLTTGAVTTIAGDINGASGVPANVAGTAARFDYPTGLTRIGTSLYVADSMSSVIRKIDLSASAAVSTLAGTAGVYGWSNNLGGASAIFYAPTGLTTDGTSLFLTEAGNNGVRKINAATGMTTQIAGGNWTSAASGVGTTDGIGTTARFYDPRGITSDGGTNLYVADRSNTIRKIDISTASNVVSTIAGTAGVSGVANGTGTAARFNWPYGIIYVNGVLYIADYFNYSIRKLQL